MYPKYTYPAPLVYKIITSMLLGRSRSFRLDALKMIASQKSEVMILGQENIPKQGPCVITFNHYHRPGFQAWWLALAVAATVEEEMHWVVTNELTFPGKWYGSFGRPLSRWVLKRLAKIYAFTGMPPMPPRPQDSETRAIAVRRVLSYIKHTERPMLGLAPEGYDDLDGKVCMPAAGTGRFGLLLASRGLSFVPVGAFESEGRFCLRFGPGYDLQIPAGLSASERDLQAARIIMQNIAKLLPTALRGEFE
jgi:hypothetical protein